MCQQPAGSRTDHPGQGRCWLHGGATPVKHGRYSSIRRPRIVELLAEYSGDARPLDTQPELLLMRALIHDYVERYDATMEALVAWHESWRARNGPLTPEREEALRAVLDEYEATAARGDALSDAQAERLALARALVDAFQAPSPAKPPQLPDVADVVKLLAEVSKAVERIEKLRQATAITLPELERLLFEMLRVVQAHVPDPAVAAAIQEGWLDLKLLGGARGG